MSKQFGLGRDVPDYMKGRLVDDVVEDLKSGVLSSDDIQISAFEKDGNLISANTRGRAALAKAGLEPTNVKLIDSNEELDFRLTQGSLATGGSLPAEAVAVTPSITSEEILEIIPLLVE